MHQISLICTIWCNLMNMRRATVTIPDDLEKELELWLSSQTAPPSLAKVMQSALRRFLAEAKLEALEYRPPRAAFSLSPAAQGSGHTDVSVEHDAHLADRD